MKKIEIITSLFPKWDPTEAEVRLWEDNLSRFPDNIVKQAVDGYKLTREGNWSAPRLDLMLSRCRNLYAEIKTPTRDNDLITLYVLECTDHKKKFKIGQKTSQSCHRKCLNHPQAVLEQAAAYHLAQVKRMYGGEYIIHWKEQGV